MKRGIKIIIGQAVLTADGTKGKVKDFLFDDNSWTMRYLEVDFGNIFSNDRILIPRLLLKDSEISMVHKDIHLSVSIDTIHMCPRPEEDLPVSRKYEEALNRHYNLENYWAYPHVTPGYGVLDNTYPLRIPSRELDKNYDSNLYSFKDINDYKIRAKDDTLGGIDDLIVDDANWQILYAVVDTNKWLPWSKKVLISISLMDKINYENQEINVNLSTETIRNAPDYDDSGTIEEQYENALYDYYERVYVQ